jgi:phage recombination protein Bet
MNQLVTTSPPTSLEMQLSAPKMLALIHRTVAKDCSDDEFNIFIGMCRALRLDPLRKQVYAFVYNKGDANKRQLTIVTSITGFRTIAERTGNYRPDEDGPSFAFDETQKSPANPLGLVSATVRVWKYSHGAWHKVTETAYWDEFAPIKEQAEHEFWEDTGAFWPDGNPKRRKVVSGEIRRVLDTSGQWGKMGRLMLAKCAEALVLRKAWPDELSNVYAEEEVDKQKFLDLTPTEIAQEGEVQERMAKIGARRSLLVSWTGNVDEALDQVPIGQFADRVFAFINENREERSALMLWQQRNRAVLREFWALCPGDALEVKKALEEALEPAENAA